MSPSDYLAWQQQLAATPWKVDFYQALRRIAAAHPHLPPLGEALKPSDEPVRVGQVAFMEFAPASLASFKPGVAGGTPARLSQRLFGLLGPNGALPLHFTETTHERALHHGDHALQRFLDTLTHRFALLFYRAWAQAQPTVVLDRRGDRSNVNRIGSLVGIGVPPLQGRDALPDSSRLHYAGRLARQTRDADGLLSWLRSELGAPVRIEQWRGHWMALGRDERTRIGRLDDGLQGRHASAQLGRGAVLGGTVWDVQHKFRIVVGPLSMPQYLGFLPGGDSLARLKAIVRHWVGLEFEWDLQLILRRADIPRLRLSSGRQPAAAGLGTPGLGRTTWLGPTWLDRWRGPGDADSLCIDVERVNTPRRARGTGATSSAATEQPPAAAQNEALH